MDLMHLVAELDELLEVEAVRDSCPNGLQVEGRAEVLRVVTAVSASQALFIRAIAHDADAILVHHGILWASPLPRPLVGTLLRRVRLLVTNNVSLLAYHLPLDRHPTLGNAAQLARRLGLVELEPFAEHDGVSTGVCGVFSEPVALDELVGAVAAACAREPQLFAGRGDRVTSVGIVTGAAEKDYHRAVAAGLDAFITGEATEWVLQQAAEDGVHYIAAGHYASERLGVLALGRWLEERHGLEVEFVDLPNPV